MRHQQQITVLVERFWKHPIYDRLVRSTKKFHAHDQHEVCKTGDLIEIKSCRPISKTKHFTFSRMLFAHPVVGGRENDLIVLKQPSHAKKWENAYDLPFRKDPKHVPAPKVPYHNIKKKKRRR